MGTHAARYPFLVAQIQFSRSYVMTLINIIVILILVGLALWLVNTYIPMAAGIKSLLNIVVFVVVLIWLLQVFALIGPIPIRIPPLK